MEAVSYLLRAFLIPTCPRSFLAIPRPLSSFFSPLFRRFLRLAHKIPDIGRGAPKRSLKGSETSI